jgi:hypothetical protein
MVSCAVNILGRDIETEVFIIGDIENQFKDFDLIIGCNTLEQLGTITFQFKDGKVAMEAKSEGEEFPAAIDGPSTSGASSVSNTKFRRPANAEKYDPATCEFGVWLEMYLTHPVGSPTELPYRSPNSIPDILFFLSLANYHGNKVPNHKTWLEPIFAVVEEDNVEWGRAQQTAYDSIVDKLRRHFIEFQGADEQRAEPNVQQRHNPRTKRIVQVQIRRID